MISQCYLVPDTLANRSPQHIVAELINSALHCRLLFGDRIDYAERKRVYDRYRPAPGQVILLQSDEIRKKLKELRTEDIQEYNIWQFYGEWVGKGVGNVRRSGLYRLGL